LPSRAVEYFYTRVENDPGKAKLTIVPERTVNLHDLFAKLGCGLLGPQHAILISG
jgi:hypothetical protein